jgi:CAAX protease family protein
MTMENESQPALGADPVTGQPYSAPPVLDTPQPKKLLAPVWHTVLMIVIMLGNSAFTAFVASRFTRGPHTISGADRYISYISSIFLELFLLAILWLGLRRYHTTIRELVSGRWDSAEDFLIDLAIAFGFWIASYAILAALSYAMGMARPGQLEETKKLASMLAPHSWGALAVFICLSCVAGFVEELIFRGYLQRQIGAIAGNIYVGLVLSALVFGAGHGYEGTRRMVLIFIFGMMFGVLTLVRKSLRPGMIAHAWFDAFQGVLLFVATRTGFIPTH